LHCEVAFIAIAEGVQTAETEEMENALGAGWLPAPPPPQDATARIRSMGRNGVWAFALLKECCELFILACRLFRKGLRPPSVVYDELRLVIVAPEARNAALAQGERAFG
jgi:hypothetical protein